MNGSRAGWSRRNEGVDAVLAGVVLVLTAAGAVEGAAQASGTPDPTVLEHVGTFPESFGYLQTVRPLGDDRVMVADPLGRVLAVADLAAGTLEPLGREGRGPGEWEQPDAVYPLPGDSTLLVDLGNTRLAVIDPAGRLVDSYPMVREVPGSGPGLEIVQPGGVDAAGRVYYQARGGMPRPGGEPDSSRVKRWEPGAEDAEVMARLSPPAVRVSSSGDANDRRVAMRPIPLAPEDDWAVAADGTVAVIRARPYRVEWFRADGTRVSGPEIAYDPVPVGRAEQERYLDERDTGGLQARMTVDNGVRSLSLQRGGGGAQRQRPAEIRSLEWPEHLPAIRSGARVAPDGRLWVRRYVAAGEPARYDIVDRAGYRVGAIRLPAGRRVIGFGGDRVFAVRVDDLGLSWLEVYR
ncbi:MAG: hypothetical protein R3314_02980 [Longimicrobiales bacterium]|nr:hypothetical protein [Longimicrobiales bacterium]